MPPPSRTFKDRYQQPSRSQSVIGDGETDLGTPEVPVTPKRSPSTRKKRKFSASPQPEMSTRLRLHPKKTPRSQGKSSHDQESPTKQRNHRQKLATRATANSRATSRTQAAQQQYQPAREDFRKSPQLRPSGNTNHDARPVVGQRPLGVSDVVPIVQHAEFIDPQSNGFIYQSKYGFGWIAQPNFVMPAHALQGHERSHSQEPRTYSSTQIVEGISPVASMSRAPSERPQRTSVLSSPFLTATKGSAAVLPMSPVLENHPGHFSADHEGVPSNENPTCSRLTSLTENVSQSPEKSPRAAQPIMSGNGSNTPPIRQTGQETDIASSLEALNNHIIELSESTGLTGCEIWTKWHMAFGEGNAHSRSHQFERFVASMKAIAQSASSDLEFETVICIVGRDIRRDQDLATTLCSPMVPNFFSSRLSASETEIESHLKAYAYDYASRKAPLQLSLAQVGHEDLQRPIREDAGPATLPSNDAAAHMEESSVVDAPTLAEPATPEPQDVKPGAVVNTKKMKEGDHRMSELKTKLHALTKTCGIARLSKSPLQYALMPKLLAANGWVLENWPEEVPFPCDVKTGKGIAGLPAQHREMLLKALEDPVFPLRVARKSHEAIPAGMPVIYGVPPPPESDFARGRRRFLDAKDTEDREGAPRRVTEAKETGVPVLDPRAAGRSQTVLIPEETLSSSVTGQLAANHAAPTSGGEEEAGGGDDDDGDDDDGDLSSDAGVGKMDDAKLTEPNCRTGEIDEKKHSELGPGSVHHDVVDKAGGRSGEDITYLPPQLLGSNQKADPDQNIMSKHQHLGEPMNTWHPGTYPVQQTAQYPAALPSSRFMPFIPSTYNGHSANYPMFTPSGQLMPVQFSQLPQGQQFPFVPHGAHARAYGGDQHGHHGAGYYVVEGRPQDHTRQNPQDFCGQDRPAPNR